MTGVEAAGLVLGAFPLILKAIDGYHGYVEPVKDLMFYKLRFDEFHRAVTIQSAKFNHSLGEILDPIVTLKTKDELLNDHKGPAWGCSKLTEELKRTLAKNYDAFTGTVQSMDETLQKLKQGLGITEKVSIVLDGSNSNIE